MSDTQAHTLYRQQAINAQQHKTSKPMLLPKLNHTLILMALVLIVAACLTYFTTQPFAQVVNVSGWINTQGQEFSITVPEASMQLSQVWVKNGQVVNKGQALLRLQRSAMSVLGREGANVKRKQMKDQYKLKLAQLHKHTENIRKRISSTHALRQSGEKQISLIEAQLPSLEKQLAIYVQQHASTKQLSDQGLLPSQDADVSLLNLLGHEQRVLSVKAQKAQLIQSQQNHKQQLHTHQHQLTQLTSDIALLKNEYDAQQQQFEASLFLTVYAAKTGVIDNINTNTGDSLAFGSKLLDIMPQTPLYQAVLAVPPSQSGFIEKGQKVQLQLSGFSYQKYGMISGTVVHVPKQVSLPLAQKNAQQPAMYMVKVSLDTQHIYAKQDWRALKSGMQVNASIQLDKLTIWQWFLAPIYEMTRYRA